MQENKIAEMIELYSQLKKKLSETVSESLGGMFSWFFEKHPDALALHFSAYAPYFNDGDPCEYSVHELRLVMKRSGESDDEEDSTNDYDEEVAVAELDDIDQYSGLEEWTMRNEERWKNVHEDFVKCEKLLSAIPDDILESAIGCCHAVIHAGGVDIREEPSHD